MHLEVIRVLFGTVKKLPFMIFLEKIVLHIRGRSRLMKKILYIAIMFIGLFFLTGCFESEPKSSLEITMNNLVLENFKLDKINDKENIFRSYLNRYTLLEVNYISFGDVIELEFEGDSPNFLYITDSIIDANGKYLYDEESDMRIEYEKESNSRYSWVVEEHFANFRTPDVNSESRIYRGIKIQAFYGEKKITYILVIQTDNKDK